MIKKLKLNNTMIFLIIIIIIYLISFLINPEYIKSAFTNFIDSLIKIIPIIILVFIILFFVNYFLNAEKIKKHLGKESGIKGWVYTLFTGSFIPMGPPYMVFPLLGELKKQGMKSSLITAFLYIRNMQIIFLIAMTYYFGILFTLILAFYVFIFSILSGILLEKILIKSQIQNI